MGNGNGNHVRIVAIVTLGVVACVGVIGLTITAITTERVLPDGGLLGTTLLALAVLGGLVVRIWRNGGNGKGAQ